MSHVDAVDEALERLSLGDLADAMPAELTQGQRKMVSVARALSARPKLLLLDEPAAGLDARESAALGHRLREVVDQGIPMLLVDHDMGLVLGISDRAGGGRVGCGDRTWHSDRDPREPAGGRGLPRRL